MTSPASVNLTALPSMLMRIWRIRPGSPRTRMDICGIHHDGELEILLVGLRRDELRRLLDDHAEVEVDHLDVDLAGLDLREVEDVVDHRQQRRRPTG